MRTKVVYSFESEIHWGAGEIVDYQKTLSGEGMFTSMSEIRDYIGKWEQRRLDLEDSGVWSKAYLPASRTIDSEGAVEVGGEYLRALALHPRTKPLLNRCAEVLARFLLISV